MTNLIQLVKSKPDPHIIKHLEDLLDRARNGEFTGIAFAVALTDGSTAKGYQIGSNMNTMTLLGAITWLLHDYERTLTIMESDEPFE